MRKYVVAICVLSSCAPAQHSTDLVPAEAFSKAAQQGKLADYSFKRIQADSERAARSAQDIPEVSMANFQIEGAGAPARAVPEGFVLKRSYAAPGAEITSSAVTMGGGAASARGQLAGARPASALLGAQTASLPAYGAKPPYGSDAPYLHGQRTSNPSLWPDQAQGTFLFNDHRAFNPMDIVTIMINDNTQGQKRAQTLARSEFDLLAGITEFFGIETRSWAANNESLNPSALVQATTENEFNGQGDIQRQANLRAQLSAVIMEILPNGVLRIEGSKIVAINNEEEIMVISGLVRQRDITSDNQVDSNRIANMRIDFYGHGTISELQSPGWGARLFGIIWPF